MTRPPPLQTLGIAVRSIFLPVGVALAVRFHFWLQMMNLKKTYVCVYTLNDTWSFLLYIVTKIQINVGK